MDRKLEAWETNVAGAFLMIGCVSVRSLGDDQFRVQSPEVDEDIEGFDEARALAHELDASEAASSR